MTHLTLAEAEELVVERMFGMGEAANDSTYEGTVFDCDLAEARDAADAFIATLNREIDPTSITIKPDRMDEMDIPCVAITIKIGGAA
jgi:hypothetical protein